MSLLDGKLVITAADVQIALDETTPQAVWLLWPDGTTSTALIPDPAPHQYPAFPMRITTCDNVRLKLEMFGSVEKVADSLNRIFAHRYAKETS